MKEESPALNIPERVSSLKNMVFPSPLGQKVRLEQSCKSSPAQQFLCCAASCSHPSVCNHKQDQVQFM